MRRLITLLALILASGLSCSCADAALNLQLEKTRYEQRFAVRLSSHRTANFLILSQASSSFSRSLGVHLERFHRTIYPRYFRKASIHPLTVVIFTTPRVYWKKNPEMNGAYAHYEPSKRALFTYRNSGLGTYFHEVVHHYVHQNYGDYTKEWFNEGVASFFEMLRVTRTGYNVGWTNWRLPRLKTAVRTRRYTPLRRFLRYKEVVGSHGLAQARHLMVYLHKLGVLEKFVKRYSQVRAKRISPGKLIEKLTGKTLEQLDREFKRLILSWRKYQKV